MKTLKQFIQEHKVTAEVRFADSNPNMKSDRFMNHYTVTLKMGRKRFTVPFSQGIGIQREPTVSDVLECLALDGAGANLLTFEEWATEYGFDTDSRDAEKTFKTIVRQNNALRKFLGEQAHHELLRETEF